MSTFDSDSDSDEEEEEEEFPLVPKAIPMCLSHVQAPEFTEPFCIVMSIIGILGSSFGSRRSGPERLGSQSLGFGAYISLFRMFCIGQLEIVRLNALWPHPLSFFGLGLFFGVLAIADSSAQLDRALCLLSNEFLPTEWLVLGLTCVYAIAVFLWIWFAKSRDGCGRRVCTFGGFAVVDICVSLWCQIEGRSTVIGAIFKTVVPTTCAALSLFLLRPVEFAEYGKIQVGVGEELAVDAISSEGSAEGLDVDSDDEK
jgi:hypothetical protein